MDFLVKKNDNFIENGLYFWSRFRSNLSIRLCAYSVIVLNYEKSNFSKFSEYVSLEYSKHNFGNFSWYSEICSKMYFFLKSSSHFLVKLLKFLS